MKDKFNAAVVVCKDDSGKMCYKVVPLKMALKALDFYSNIYNDVQVFKCNVNIDFNTKF